MPDNKKVSAAKQAKLDKIEAEKRKKKKTLIIIISIIAGSLILLLVSAIIYHQMNKDKKNNSGINILGQEKGYDSSVTLGEYKGIHYSEVKPNVTEAMIDNYIEQNLLNADNQTIDYSRDNTEVLEKDTLSLTITFTVGELSYRDLKINYIVGSNEFGTELDRTVVGMMVGSTGSCAVKISDDYEKEAIAGKEGTADFKVEAVVKVYTEVTEENVLELTDGEFKSVSDYRESVYNTLMEKEENKASELEWTEIWNTIVGGCTFSIDEKAINDEYDTMINYYESYANYLSCSLEDLVTKAYGYSELQDFYDYCRNYSETVVKEKLVYEAIIDKEGISVSDSDYNERIVNYMSDAGYTNQADFEELMGGKAEIMKLMADDMVSELILLEAIKD